MGATWCMMRIIQHRQASGETDRPHDAQTGVRCLQVGDETSLVPQQAAVTQFDGGDEVSSTISLRLITENRNDFLSSDLIRFHIRLRIFTHPGPGGVSPPIQDSPSI